MGFPPRTPKTCVYFTQPRLSFRVLSLFSVTLTGLLLPFCCPLTLSAQTGKGSIAGRALDSGGGILQGAVVELQPSGAATTSNNQGDFAQV